MDYPKVVGLCGDIGSGKSTAVEYMAARHGYQVRRFATRLKELVLALYAPLGMEPRHVFGTQADKSEPLPCILDAAGAPLTGRRILEHVGTEGFRAICPDTWVNLALFKETGDVPTVFEDCRFSNEFQAIRKAGGVVWEVVKVGGEVQRTGHASDEEWRELPKDGHLVARAGDVESLHRGIDLLLAEGGRESMATRLVHAAGEA